jgi:D-3-phosphoglycerate dehydrogenase
MIEVLATLSRTFYETYPAFEKTDAPIRVDLFLTDDKPLDRKTVLKHIRGKDIYVVTTELLDKEAIDAADRLRLIVKYGVGVDNIDLDYAAEKGVAVTNAPGQNTLSVADLTMALLLSAARNVPQASALVKAGGWKLFMGYELDGKTLGIVGFGSIGKEVAKRARGFGMKLIAYDSYRDEKAAAELGVSFVPLEELLKASDFVCLNLALTAETRHLINRGAIDLMKSTAYLVNTSRGPVIDERDLIPALRSRRIAGAALDVYETEPADPELAGLDNVIATPHIAGSTYEASKRMAEITLGNIVNCIEGREYRYLVNKPAFRR